MDYKEYNTYQEHEAILSGASVRYFWKLGLPYWSSLLPIVELLNESILSNIGETVILIGCDFGVLATTLAHRFPNSRFLLMDQNLVMINCARKTLENNQVSNCEFIFDGNLSSQRHRRIDSVLMQLPKGRALSRRLIVEAFFLLRPGGHLYLAGSNDLGIQSIIKDGDELFTNSTILSYRKGHRIARFQKSTDEPAQVKWLSDPGIFPGSWVEFKINLDGVLIPISSLPGIFSSDHLDQGSSLLLESLNVFGHHRILDIGCGYGILGIAAARRSMQFGQNASIDLLDSNFMAVAAARKNIQDNHIPGANIQASDLLDAVRNNVYDLIISNPPFHAGKEVNYAITHALIQQAFQALVSGGQVMLVANRFIRYEKLVQQIFRNHRILSQNNHYHVISAEK